MLRNHNAFSSISEGFNEVKRNRRLLSESSSCFFFHYLSVYFAFCAVLDKGILLKYWAVVVFITISLFLYFVIN